MGAGTTKKPKPRVVRFKTPQELAADVDRLHRGGYEKHGNWNLPQICRHLTVAIEGALRPPASTTPTPEQAKMKAGLVDVILKTLAPPPGLEAPDFLVPPADCDERDIERFKQVLWRVFEYPHSHVDFGPAMGPVPTDEMRELTLLHASHHLAYLEPKLKRRENLRYASDEDVAADVRKLRNGYTRAGAWTLPQACCHLDLAMKARMQPGPFPPTTPEQEARRPMMREILASGQMPDGLQSPEPFLPPPSEQCGDDAIDSFLATLEKWKSYPGPFAPHRIFGQISPDEWRALNRIHCARHFSFLTPTS
jgi:hypothetical protein